ncbi:hypothetical protein ACHMW5_13655 [Azospirillum melinis]|uniref:hypothetical protein n=1 Tax=Azospirillum melinis TaxID=328839 RepID=UPI003756B07E
MRGRPVQIVRGSDWCVPWEILNVPDDGCVLTSFPTQGAALAYCRMVGAKVVEVRNAREPARRPVT